MGQIMLTFSEAVDTSRIELEDIYLQSTPNASDLNTEIWYVDSLGEIEIAS